MTRRGVTDALTLLLALLYIGAGIAETVRAVSSGDGGIAFWFGTLVGGGALLLLGLAQRRQRNRRYLALVTVGALAGVLATLWTFVVPALAVAVIVLAARTAEAAVDADPVAPAEEGEGLGAD